MRTYFIIGLLPIALVACGGDGKDEDTSTGVTDTTTAGDDDDDTVPPGDDDDDTVPPGDDDDTVTGDDDDDDDTIPTEPSHCEESGYICVFAGIPGVQQFSGEGLAANAAALNLPIDVAISPAGDIFISDYNNHRIRMVDSYGFMNTITGTGFLGDGVNTGGEGAGGPALQAAWNHPTGMAFPPGDSNNMWVAAWHNSRVNRIALDEMWVYFEIGDGARAFGGDGLDGSLAQLDLPSSIAFDDAGMMYISDEANQIIRMVDAAGVISTIAGTPKVAGYAGDGGPANLALLHTPLGQDATPAGRIDITGRKLYIPDTMNQVIRVIDLDTMIIDRVAGNYVSNGIDPVANPLEWGGVPGYSGDGGDPLLAELNKPTDLAIAPTGEIYIADTGNHCVRVIANGIIDTFAGTCGVAGDDGENVLAKGSLLNTPYGVAVGPDGKVYIADQLNQVIRVVTP